MHIGWRGRGRRERSLNVHTASQEAIAAGWGLCQVKAGSLKLIPGLPHDCWYLGHHLLPPSMYLSRKLGWKLSQELNAKVLTWANGVLSNVLTAVPDACH